MIPRPFKPCWMFALAACLVACDTPQKRGLRELARAGVEPSGLALLDAVNTRDSQRVGWLLDVGVYTEQQDPSGRTPVRIAIDHQDLPSVLKLLDAKANVNATTADGVSVLGSAVGQGETAIINPLLSAGARSGGLMPDGEKILPWAIRNGQLASVRAMLKSGADPHLKDRAGNPLLHVAMESGHRELMESLLQLGADSGALNRAGETTLHLASRNGWMDALPRLAAAGADPNAPDRDGSTLLEQAIAAGNRDQIRLLLKIGADPNRRPPSADRITPLERVFFKNADFPLFQVFLDRGVLPPEGKWDPWLRRTYDDRNREAARFLLNHGARATTPAPDGLLLMEAAALDHAGSFVKLLADYGNPGGNSLWRAVHRGDRDMVSLLLACGVPVNGTRIPTRETLLSFAIRRKQDRIASSLVRNGADLTLLVPEGQVPLHLAIATACHRTVKSMLDAGADPNTPFLLPVSPDFIKRVRPGAMTGISRR
ncbi:ankyrin repeat domain-containing protein [bacterium]|nr:ankyrin repeat domain-containing protein [bacterium]